MKMDTPRDGSPFSKEPICRHFIQRVSHKCFLSNRDAIESVYKRDVEFLHGYDFGSF